MRAPAGQLAREAIEALVNADAHLVLCNQGKRPLSAGWQDEANRPTAEQAIAHAAAGGLLGVIPSSINLLAVDVDTDAAGSDLYASMLRRRGLVEQAIGEPLATVPTRSGGGHMLYRAPEGEVGNRRWLYGDIRGTRGYCVVWDAARWLAAMSAAPAAEPVNVNALPLTRNGGHHGPVAIAGAPVGERNDTLNREAFKAVVTAKRDGTVVDLRPHRDAALDAGLSADEVDRTLDSAIAGGIEKGDKPAAPRQRPPVPPMRKLLADDDDTETPDAIVPGLLWDGCVTILTAAAKAGKTTLLAHAVGAAYTSAVFLGERCGGDSGRPLCIWSEMPLGMLRTWVRRHIDNPEAPIYADCMRRVDQIGREDVLRVLTPIWTTKPEIGRKVRQRIRATLAWAQAHGHVEHNVAGEAINAALPSTGALKTHLRALPYRDVAAALETIEASRASVSAKACLRFVVLTACRSGEARGATWAEVDLDAREWRVPAARMKMGIEHRVPLSAAALAVLEQMRPLRRPADLVFPSPVRPGQPLSDMTLTKVLRDTGLADRATVHGFRSAFRTWSAERTSAPHAVCEMALAHRVGSDVERSYVRSDLFEKRRGLMDQWAAYVAGGSATVVRLHG